MSALRWILAAGAVTMAGWAAEVDPRASGRLELPFARTGLRPVAYASDWTRRDGRGDGSVFEISDAGRPVLSGSAEFREDAGAIAAVWRMKAVRDWCGKGVYVTAELPMEAYAEGELTADGKTLPLNAGGTDPTLFYGSVRTLALRATDRKRLLTLAFARPVRIRLQDNRKWRGKTFSLRVELGGEKLATGETLELACRVSTADALTLPRPPAEPIAQGTAWVPMLTVADVQPGSALDFSNVCGPRQPVGTFGRVIRRGDHFEFEQKPGVPQRFYGVNLCGSAVTPTPEEAPKLADRLVRMGYNAVRIHHHENAVTGPDGFTLDPERMRLFRLFVDACTARGIYVTTDLFVSRGPISRRSIGENRDGNVETGEYKELVLFHEGAFSNYVAWARQFLGHMHPVTGRRLAEEPALAWLCLVNEGNLGNNGMRWMREYPVVAERWRQWLDERKREMPGLWCGIPEELPINVSLADDRSEHLAAFTVFMGELECRFVSRMRKFLREEMNCRALVTDMNAWRYPAAFQLPRFECLDFADEHHYFDHPEFDSGRWQLPSRCGNANPFRTDSQGVPNLAVRRIFGQPFVVSEYGYCAPSAYRSVGGLLFGALAALQDWSGVWRFAWSHGPVGVTAPETKTMDYFDLTGDPLALATERAAICLFLRGDVVPATGRVPLALDRDRLSRPEVPAPTEVVGHPERAWTTRIGCEIGRASSVSCGAAEANACAVSVDTTNGTLAVVSPRTCGVFAEGGRISAGCLTVELRETRATVWTSALDGRPLVESERILVTHLTDALDAGTRFGDARHRTLLGWGGLPHLMRRGRAKVELGLAGSGYRVYALAPDGSRRRDIAAVVGPTGDLGFETDVAADPQSATWLYEVVKEK